MEKRSLLANSLKSNYLLSVRTELEKGVVSVCVCVGRGVGEVSAEGKVSAGMR